ncbi:3-deoxy-7-phosphoheptulonate synthase [Ascochyta rabiei]|uniref:Helix-turn-helix domain-containing protein n=1 Tax=Didymella rabiei TaxID=5454 RepID=A0A162Y9M7_DIDRA|nr:3-deoxy-7-phosphoheptulonate synthase [Ascochyta rabiei]KZM19901.1 hypothetical protein ST47_g9030 [Ascochyta rabiei]UPX13798.1 3-deoxy-7-phosphoheptulonate synthase [Ascochyta rabiei]
MGSSASKGASAAGAAARKYPTRAPPSNVTARAPAPSAPRQATSARGRTVEAGAQFSESKPAGGVMDTDARDAAFAERLASLGAVQPNPHYSPTSRSQFDPRPQSQRPAHELLGDMMQAPPQSAFPDARNNPVLRVLEARQRIADEAEQELSRVGRRGFEGRKYVDAGVIQLALMRQARGEPAQRIEQGLGIKKGRLSLLSPGTVGAVQTDN